MTSAVNKPYHMASKFLTPQEYFEILLNADESYCLKKAPVRPKPEEVFVVANNDNLEDWKADQYMWRDIGFKNLPKENPIISCHYYRSYDGSPFFRRAYILFENNRKYAEKTVIHYTGCLENLEKHPHGNRKYNLEKEHVMTAKSVIFEQKRLLRSLPQKIYKQQTEKDVHPALAPAFIARDRKQVANTVYKERQKRLLSNDDIVGVYLLDQELPDFVQAIVLAKDFYVILSSKQSTQQFNDIAKFEETLLSYDTTFNLGDFYVSSLTYKHPLLQGEPVIPLAYLIHDQKKKVVHSNFFNFLRKHCSNLNGVPIVTDREVAINSAIAEELFNSKNFYCWNHLINDVKYWIKKQKGGEIQDEKIYTNHVWDLLDSASCEEFNVKFEEMSNEWSERFKTYFEKHLYHPIKASGKWVLLEHKKYTPRSGITNNAAESLNNVLKNCVDRKEVNLQVLILTLYQLDLYYQREILRGLCNIGNYCLKENYRSFTLNPLEVDYPKSHLALEQLPYVFFNKDFRIQKLEEERPYTNFSIAKTLVLEGNVKLITEDQVFLVKSMAAGKPPNVVTLFPQENCSCKARKNCHHITAAKLSIGFSQQKQIHTKLSTLLRRERGFKSGRKRMPKNITVVEAADDSVATESSLVHNSVLVPTIVTGSDKIKNRFYSLIDHSTSLQLSIPTATSTPKLLKRSSPLHDDKSVAAVATKRMRPRIILSSNDEDNYTFKKKFQNNKQFFIGNATIYPQNLKPIAPKPGDTDLYMGDSAIDCYLNILCFETENITPKVSTFPVEGYVINEMTREHSYTTALYYFCRYNIPEKDIVIFPLTKNFHITIFFIIRKMRIVLYLDSLGFEIPKDALAFILQVYAGYAELTKNQFSISEWNVYAPKDVVLQKNNYDCGAYCCLFSEILLIQDEDALAYTKDNDLKRYRLKIKEKLIRHMKFPIIPKTSCKKISQRFMQKIESLQPPKILVENIYTTIPSNENSTLNFILNIIRNY